MNQIVPIQPTPLKLDNYGAYCQAAFNAEFPDKPSGVLWYYTTGATFTKVIGDGSVWATQISCLNDHAEFRHSVGLVRAEVGRYRECAGTVGVLAKQIYDSLEDDAADRSNFFVFCMSTKRDSLSQWRAYGGGEGGWRSASTLNASRRM
jgi:hypothetical protein